jgi:hypothetical protein
LNRKSFIEQKQNFLFQNPAHFCHIFILDLIPLNRSSILNRETGRSDRSGERTSERTNAILRDGAADSPEDTALTFDMDPEEERNKAAKDNGQKKVGPHDALIRIAQSSIFIFAQT